MYIKRGFPILTQIDKLGLIGFISSLGFACAGTIWAIYLDSFIHNESYVGFLVTLFTIIGLLSYIFIIPFIGKNSKSKIYTISLFLYAVSYLLFGILDNLQAAILLSIFVSIVASLRITTYGIIVSDKSKKQSLARNEGLIYTLLNISWLIGPLLAGFIARQYGLRSVFFIASIFVSISFILLMNFNLKDDRIKKKSDGVLKSCADFFRNKDLKICYILSGAINFWWALIYIYVPMKIIDSGYNPEIVGYFLFAITIPLILFTYFFGKLAGKIGFKKIFFIGYFIIGVIGILCFFLNNLILILSLLVLASVGAAMVESTTEAYFFDISKKEKDKYYGVYNTGIDVSHALATFFGAIILFFLSFKFLFAFFGIIMISIAILSLKIKNIVESKRR